MEAKWFILVLTFKNYQKWFTIAYIKCVVVQPELYDTIMITLSNKQNNLLIQCLTIINKMFNY